MKRKIISTILFVLGFGLCFYPLVSNLINRIEQGRIISTYKEDLKEDDTDILQEYLNEAEKYNEALAIRDGGIVNADARELLTYENYNNLLNLSDKGVMGSIEIPNIDVNLPIYHGTEEENIVVGAGHVYGSSLPVGGSSTHSLLTSHSGLANAKLFTRLDEMKTGDLFYITVCNSVLTYKVCNIQVIKPEEVDSLTIQEGKDLVSLITCTPYGINTHRLIVTGERTDYQESSENNTDSLFHSMSIRELIFTLIPFVLVIIAIINGIKHRKGRKQSEKN